MPEIAKYYTRAIVHGVIPAADAHEALELLQREIREGIGAATSGRQRREHDISIAASVVQKEGEKPEIIGANQEFMKRLATGERLNDPYAPGDLGPIMEQVEKLNKDGEIAVAMSVQNGRVRVDFSREVKWMGLRPEQAEALGQALISQANEARGGR